MSKKSDNSKYWKLASFTLLGIILFGGLFDIKVESKFGQSKSSSQYVGSVDLGSRSDTPNLRNISAPQGNGGCGV